jgi:VWFA-related protein
MLLGGLLLLAYLPGRAQEAQEPTDSGLTEEVRVLVRLVDFLVVDKSGKPVLDLRADEVEIWDEGDRQEILDFIPAHRRFERPADPAPVAEPAAEAVPPEPPAEEAPATQPDRTERRWIVFLFDVRNLSYQGRARSAKAVQQLVAEHLHPDDRVALMVDDDELRMLVPFTTDHQQVIEYIRSPEGLSSRYRDIERRLSDLRDDTESCRLAAAMVDCAQQAATTFVFESSRETETSLDHLEALVRSLAAIPDRKILFYVSEGFLVNPGDVASAAVEYAIGQYGYNVNAVRSFLQRDYRYRLDLIHELAIRSRTGLYAVNTMRKMVDDLFSPERQTEGGPENLPKARTDPFEAAWQQVRKVHSQMARSTGAVALFRRDPQGLLAKQLDAAAGVYTVSYSPTGYSWDRRKIKIKVARKKVRVLYRNKYSLVAGENRRMSGTLTVRPPGPREPGGLVRADLEVRGSDFEIAPGSKPRVSVASLFFELRDANHQPVQDLFEMIAFPRGEETGYEMFRRPFAVRVPPGDYTLRVDVSDVNGPGRDTFSESFSVRAPGEAEPEAADAVGQRPAGGT